MGVGPVCVPRRGDRYSGMVTLAGWGTVEPGRVEDSTLRSVDLLLLNISRCSHETLQRDRVKPEEIKNPGDEEPQICAGYPQRPIIKDACSVCFIVD